MKIHTLVRFLYETISRLQDAFGLEKQQFIDHFDKNPKNDYEFIIRGKKTAARKAKIEPKLMDLIVKYANSHNDAYIWGADSELNAFRQEYKRFC